MDETRLFVCFVGTSVGIIYLGAVGFMLGYGLFGTNQMGCLTAGIGMLLAVVIGIVSALTYGRKR